MLDDMPVIAHPRAFLADLFHVAVAAAQPTLVMQAFMPEKPVGRTIVIGAGKASAAMARAFEQHWPHAIDRSAVVTRYGYAEPCERTRILEAAHPVPDAAGLEAAKILLETIKGLHADDLVVALISGGGSALLPAPPQGLTLDDEQDLNRALLASGAPIGVMNAIRQHVSAIKGGRLALAAAPARMVSLILSDVPGDNPAEVASGPTLPAMKSRSEVRDFIEHYRIALPPAIARHLASRENAPSDADHPVFKRNAAHVIGSAALSLEAAAAAAQKQGLEAVILSDAIEGESRDVAMTLAAIAREVSYRNRPFRKPVLLLSGGETTVSLRNSKDGWGKGGRNAEFALAFARAIAGMTGIHCLAADTDGIDGSEENAGAFCDGETVRRLAGAGKDATAMLNRNDAWTAFSAIGDLFVTGPTRTNVNDFRAILVQ
jgi:glycerate 2-kinase